MSAGLLSLKQRQELHRAIADYLSAQQYEATQKQFLQEASVDATENSGSANLLEKKWMSVLRLQRKVIELEGKITELESTLQSLSPMQKLAMQQQSDPRWLPKTPAAQVLSAAHRLPVTCLHLHPSAPLLLSGSEDTTIKVWDYLSATPEATCRGHTKAVLSVQWHPTGDAFASSSADTLIKLWHRRSDGEQGYTCTRTLAGHDHVVSALHFDVAGDTLFSAGRDATLRGWQIETGHCLWSHKAHEDWIRCLAVTRHRERTLIASGGNDRHIKLWEGQKEEGTLRGHQHVIECVAFVNPQKDTEEPCLLSGSRDKNIILWHFTTRQALFTFTGHQNWVRGIAVHPQSTLVYSVSDDRSIRCWDLVEKKLMATITDAHQHFVSAVAFSGHSRPGTSHASPSTSAPLILVTGGVDGDVRCWGPR